MTSFANISSGTCPSDSLAEIIILTDATFADIRIGDGSLFEERLYASAGQIKIFGLNKIINDYLLKYNLIFKYFSIIATPKGGAQVHVDMTVFYSDRRVICSDFSLFLQNCFLTTRDIRRISAGRDFSLFLYLPARAAVSPKVAFSAFDDHGRKLSSSFQMQQFVSPAGVAEVKVSYSEILEHAQSELPGAELDSFTISEGARAVSCFVDRSLSEASVFSFLNNFAILEDIAFPTESTVKTTQEISIAEINGVAAAYDSKARRVHEVTAAPITRDEAIAAEQFLLARKKFYRGREIIVSEFSCEIPDCPEKTHSVKFSWRYPLNSPDIYLQTGSGIFSQEYDPSFS